MATRTKTSAKLVDMHYNQVATWRKRYEEFGLIGETGNSADVFTTGLIGALVRFQPSVYMHVVPTVWVQRLFAHRASIDETCFFSDATRGIVQGGVA